LGYDTQHDNTFILQNRACEPLQTMDEVIAKQNKDNEV